MKRSLKIVVYGSIITALCIALGQVLYLVTNNGWYLVALVWIGAAEWVVSIMIGKRIEKRGE
jgi:hypothetical protein